jgi:DNA (cytosine-5)-methyltransferase 1
VKLPRGLTFIDIFAGCGGLSLGLMQAGWRGLFAIEADTLAFQTLKYNLIDSQGHCKYDWPDWLNAEPIEISRFIRKHRSQLEALSGQIDLLAGGPPCQGFSFAGRRKKNDPRNELFKHYLEIVKIIKPKLLFFENVKGVTVEFGKKHRGAKRGRGRPPIPFSVKIQKRLHELGYEVFPLHVRAADFGVPQWRPRYIMVAISRDLLPGDGFDPFRLLKRMQRRFLRDKGLPTERDLNVSEAISDLEVSGKELVPCEDAKGYWRIPYAKPLTRYQEVLHGSLNGTAPNSLRIARHCDEVRDRFQVILDTCRRGIQLNPEDRSRIGLKKKCTVPLRPDQPSHTLTTLPDDLIHYAEPRILTVREYARIQSFPDWYEFKGKYTTGGEKRVRECPRYTQVGNAVPPFMAEVLGRLLARIAKEISPKRKRRSRKPIPEPETAQLTFAFSADG